MADKIFPWTESIVPDIPDDYIWDCVDTEITELPNLVSWCVPGQFRSMSQMGFDLSSELQLPSSVTETWGFNSTNDHRGNINSYPYDTILSEGQKNNNFWNIDFVLQGFFSGNNFFGMMKFDFERDELNDKPLPTDTEIISATLYFYPSNQFFGPLGDSPPDTLNFYRLLKDWEVKECSWNNAKTGESWETPGAQGSSDISPSSSFSVIIPDLTFRWYSVDVTDDIKDMVLNPSGNNGWKIVGDSDSWISSVPRQGVDGQRPYLEITYIPG